MAVTNPKSAEGALKLARVCESVYSGLTRILQNRSLLLGRTTIEYESEFSRWTCCFPRCPYWARARSAIPRTVLQKTEREGEREFWRTGDRVCRRPYTHSGRLNSSVRSIRSFHAELKLDRPNRCLERSTVIFVRGVIDPLCTGIRFRGQRREFLFYRDDFEWSEYRKGTIAFDTPIATVACWLLGVAFAIFPPSVYRKY